VIRDLPLDLGHSFGGEPNSFTMFQDTSTRKPVLYRSQHKACRVFELAVSVDSRRGKLADGSTA
jgi:hypothetical protein